MGKTRDDAQNLVEEKLDDTHGSSNTSSSREKRRKKSKKAQDGMELETTAPKKPGRSVEKLVKEEPAVEATVFSGKIYNRMINYIN